MSYLIRFLLPFISVVLTSFFVFASLEKPACMHGCSNGQICLNSFDARDAICVDMPSVAPLRDLELPFDKTVDATCTHSSGSGSHSGANAFYALDLATPYAAPAAVVRASADGTAFVFGAADGSLCPEPGGTPERTDSSSCGDSWGNRVKILHDGGYASFYVHLDRATVLNGAVVKRGDPIGVEGATGAAGHRHLHWSVQKIPGISRMDWIRHIAWAGESVPFKFRAVHEGVAGRFDSSKIECAHSVIGAAPAAKQPKFSGIR